tara:strand:- start:11791 stop:12969 length:1179 start_codon:yes stop_codon:yes gene_type:complete
MNNNKIYDLNDPFDFSLLHLANPSLINNNNYFSKISQGSMKKNLYLQLPKCTTKQGIVKSSSKSYCELCYGITEKTIIEFLENLEKHILDEIYKNRELWFYNADSMTLEDIEDLMTPLIKTYKHGKNFLLKNNIKLDKFKIYDENENNVTINDYNLSHEFIPLININGVKFSSKNFSIDLVLTQMMVIYPSEEFEQQVLIKTNKKPEVLEEMRESRESVKVEKKEIEESKPELEIMESKELEEPKPELEEPKLELEEPKLELEESKDLEECKQPLALERNVEIQIEEPKETEQFKAEKEDTKENQSFKYLTNANELTQIDTLDLNEEIENTPIEIKTRDEIYLEIYKKAKKKAKEIRKNAIEAFLQAKNIKSKYNLDSLVESSSSEEEEEYI